jgi:hypothetical protein
MTAKKTDELLSLYKHFAESQRRHQVAVLVILSAFIAVATALYTWITWESVVARREANELQKQLIELQRAGPASRAALTPRSDAHRAIQANAEPQRVPTRTPHSLQEESTGRQTAIDAKTPPTPANNSQPNLRSWSTRSAMLDHPGRQ